MRSAIAVLAVAAACLLLGGATSYGQTLLPESLSSLANSLSGWTAAMVLLVRATGLDSVLAAAVAGALGFAGLDLGYQLVSTARGFVFSGELWLLIAVIAGPFLGTAASWLRRRDVYAALGVAAVAAVGIGDGLLGLLFLPTTSPVYWTLSILAGLALLTVVSARLRSAGIRALAIVGTAILSVLLASVVTILF